MSVSSRPHPCAVVCVGRRFVNQAAYAFAGASPMPIDRLVVADCIMPIEEIEARRRALLVYHSVIFSTAAQSLARSAGPDFAAALLLRLAVKDLPLRLSELDVLALSVKLGAQGGGTLLDVVSEHPVGAAVVLVADVLDDDTVAVLGVVEHAALEAAALER